jgi:hypothetical protein
LYRIYLKEAGFPRRKLIEFYKSGTSIGDPVREPGPGANPMREEGPRGDASPVPASPVSAAKPAREDAASAWEIPQRAAHPAVGAAMVALAGLGAARARGRWDQLVEKAMKESGETSFHRAARLRRRLRRPR